MKSTLQLLAALITAGCMVLTTARGQSVYATPYSFVTIAGPSQFQYPEGLTVSTNGNVFVVDYFDNAVFKVAPVGTNWVVSTVIAPGAQLNEPSGITMDRSNNLYVVDSGDNTLRKLAPSGGNWILTTIAGNPNNNNGADGTNTDAHFHNPSGIAMDSAGNLYVADTYNDTIRKATPLGTNWVFTTIAGTLSSAGSNDGTNQAAQFYLPAAVAVDTAGNLFVADSGNYTIRKMTPVGTNWVVSTIAGSGGQGSTDGTNTDAQFNYPYAIAVDAADNVFVADTYNNTIRKITPVGTNWVTTTLAGVADNSNGGDADGSGTNALFSFPYGIAVDSLGNLFVGDTSNNLVRKGSATAVPNLSVSVAGGSVVISWPGSAGTLQTNASLTTATWNAYGGPVSNSNGTNSVTLPPSAGALFFRLTN